MDSLEGLFSLRGHRGLVTGASSGLGVDCAHALALAGADVAVLARREDRVKALAAELTSNYHIKAFGIGADVSRAEDIEWAFGECSRALGGEIDILVNNAGVSPTGRAENFKREQWDNAIAVNLTAPMLLSQHLARALIAAKKPGRIINMSSIYGTVASSVYRLSAYTASKAGLANLTRQLAVEWAPHGILVNAIAPGWIPTEATEGGIAKAGNKERMEQFTPLGRLGTPEEIRGAVVFLASAASSYVTGTVLAVDGGYTAW
jgi:NAD(P)-dependent dehydrogenase (short-subunit alcohol dehydrogenase family)